MKTVRVLLAAYNGEKYIERQIDSILSQQGVRISLLVRDDGSDDGTREILAGYAHRLECVCVYAGKNRGAAGSFYDLLARTDMEADYYAFADQDDVWREDKLLHAVELLEQEKDAEGAGKRLPLLYAGKVVYASRDLKKQEEFSYQIARSASFGNALVENICMGCTQVFNQPLLKLVRGHLPPDSIMHDWWMYLTAAYFGRVLYDQQAYMLYRQHGDNQIGMHNCWAARWKNRLRHMAQLKNKLSGQAAAFQKAYEGLLDGYADAIENLCWYEKNLDILEQMCGYKNSFYRRACLAADKRIYRQNRMDDLLYRLLFLTGYL